MGKMTTEQFQLYERRIDNCLKAAENAVDQNMKDFWQLTAMSLLRKMNWSLSSAGSEQLPSKQ
jgi:hypothetical protein|tara:strand:+ start:156 stop:344 length:189 start_codon:yes stop_codon:yes gene_type:complete